MHLPLWLIYCSVILACVVAVGAQDYGFSTCWKKLDAILVGNLTIDRISNETISEYLWEGPITGLTGQRPIALGYKGCQIICGRRTDAVSARSALEMVTTWIFPLAIIFNHTALAYGLFRPLSQYTRQPDRDQKYTAELLSMIAFQLRMLRRRGVVPTLASLLIFIAAFVFSLVLAFHQEADNRTGSPLTLGLLYCWLPMLVIFTIIDRNPVSADRSAALMSRWLFNVNAVLNSAQAAQDAGADLDRMDEPEWWARTRSEDELSVFRIKEFIGQGRKIEYCGLPYATIETWDELPEHRLGGDLNEYTDFSKAMLKRLKGARPRQWHYTAWASLSLVLIEVMMAFFIAFCTPTFGLGCWSGGMLLYGVLSTMTWVCHFIFKAPGKWGQRFCTLSNFLAFGWLITLTGFVLSGGFRTCWCSTVQLNYPLSGGYMMFESFDYYLRNFEMLDPWIAASAVGGAVPLLVLLVAIFWWKRCQYLWSTQETEPLQDFGLGDVRSRTDTSWLAA